MPYDTSLNSLLHNQDLKDLLAPSVFKQVNLVRKLGNDAVHASIKIQPEEALHALKIMHGFTSWVIRVYSGEKIEIPAFDESLISKETPAVKYKEKNCSIRSSIPGNAKAAKAKGRGARTNS